MAETAEPPFTSLQARIAALKQQSNGNPLIGPTAITTKRPPPPPPPTDRPSLPSRHTINNPPLASLGSSVSQRPSNQPLGARGQVLLPPPPVDRDQPAPPIAARTPPLPARNGPPPLPSRKASQPSPALPPRRTSTQLVPAGQMVRRGSNASTVSNISTVSGLSGGNGSSLTTVSSGEGRKLPPVLGEAKLPPLPPTKRERDETDKIARTELAERRAREREAEVARREADAARFEKVPLIKFRSAPVVPTRPHNGSLKSPPSLPVREIQAVVKDAAPRMPSRPGGPPKLPERPGTGTGTGKGAVEDMPQQAVRRLPPPAAATKSILQMGFGNKPKETPKVETPAPQLPVSRPETAVVELTKDNFHSSIEGKFALVDFYGPRCSDCVRLEPTYTKVGQDWGFAPDKLVIAKINGDESGGLMHKYGGNRYPAVVFFDGSGRHPEKFAWPDYPQPWGVESFTRFLEDRTGMRVEDGLKMKMNGVSPPIKMSSKPSARDVEAVQARPARSGCLKCRDFSGPDTVAAQYPRESLPRSHDLTGYLADVLCMPFSSATDKARAIFTWLHHNIAYDVDAFFGNRVKHVEPKDTVTTGLAVCGGYAGLFTAIALKAGMEAIVVTGHGKGFGHTALKPGERPPPPDPSGHAWNAVRIDGGEW